MVKVVELFSGIGACSKALERLGIEHTIIDAVEIDKYAIKSFNAIHGTNFDPQDITEWDKDIECDLIMHGSPCQDFSIAGKGAGGDFGSGTRSSLMYETLRIVEKLKPKYVIWENVKNLLSKKHRHNFDAYLKAMADLGYDSKYQVLNAKDYGIPQNRERVFTVSIRQNTANKTICLNSKGGRNGIEGLQPSRKDRVYSSDGVAATIATSDFYNPYYKIEVGFSFPKPMPLTKRLKDFLEDDVDEKYYLSEERLKKIAVWEQRQIDNNRGFRFEVKDGDDIGRSITTSGDRPSSTNYMKVRTATKKGYAMAKDGDGIDLAYPQSTTRRGRVGDGVAKTIECTDTMGVVNDYRIRKLTPLECWRLMGFDDADFKKAKEAGISDTQLYKQAGNSIVVNVLEEILRKLYRKDEDANS